MEIDLYWFQGGEQEERIASLFDRLEPLWRQVPEARKGLLLCVGWLYDSVLYWNGDAEAVIATCQPPVYEPWTYARLGRLVRAIRNEAERRGLDLFHVGLLLLGGRTMFYNAEETCEGWSGRTEETKERAHYSISGKWFDEHPEIDDSRYAGVFDLDCVVEVQSGERVCTLARPAFSDYLADKATDLLRTLHMNAVVFRDHVFTPAYRRGNRERYMGAADREALNGAFIRLLARLKAGDPELVVIGYGSGTSAMEEWRSHGFDLEKVAAAGALDVWVTQTWASAWQDYWPAHGMGYTFQLANLLVQRAMLANTKTRHLFLMETFDAWEPWDSIHQYPSKTAWEAWAYSHVTLCLPDGNVKRPEGVYISWMNRGEELIPEETVARLCRVFRECAEDLAREPVPGGPLLVYHREGLESLSTRPEAYSRGEEMDDWTAMLHKYGAPVLSITRSEWLPEVEADAVLFPAPHAVGATLERDLLRRLEAGKPLLFMGQAAGIPPALREALRLDVREQPALYEAPVPASVRGRLSALLDTGGLVVNQRQNTLLESEHWETLIAGPDGPLFAAHRSLPCLVWETPEWGTPLELHLTAKSVQSPQTYHAVAAVLSSFGWGRERYAWRNEDWQKPVDFLCWRYPEGEAACLLGNLETGLTGSSQFAVKGWLSGVAAEKARGMVGYEPGWLRGEPDGVRVAIAPHGIAIVQTGAADEGGSRS